MWRWPSSRTAVVGIAIGVFVVCCLLPVGYLLAVSVSRVDAYSAIALDARQRSLLSNTALLGIGTALLATAIGAPLGIALARIALPRKAFLRLALAAPVLLPPYIAGLAWTYVGSRQGWLTALTGSDLLSAWIYSLPAAIVVLSLVLYPVSMLATEVAMRRIDGRLEEAALMVAPPGRVLRRTASCWRRCVQQRLWASPCGSAMPGRGRAAESDKPRTSSSLSCSRYRARLWGSA